MLMVFGLFEQLWNEFERIFFNSVMIKFVSFVWYFIDQLYVLIVSYKHVVFLHNVCNIVSLINNCYGQLVSIMFINSYTQAHPFGCIIAKIHLICH